MTQSNDERVRANATMSTRSNAPADASSICAGLAVLGSEPLWDAVMAFLPGYPRVLCAFYRECNADSRVRSAYIQLLARDDSLVREGLVSHLAVLVGDANVLRLVHKLIMQQRQSGQTRRMDPKLSLARVMYCAVLFRRVDMLERIAELRARDPEWQWERGLLATALRRTADADLAVLAWLYDHLPPEMRLLQPSDMCAYARTSRIDVIQWLHEHGCAITQLAMNGAAYNKRTDVLAYLYAHSSDADSCSRFAFEVAARDGALEIVKIIAAHAGATTASACAASRSERCSTKAMDDAACNGHLDVIRYLHEYCRERCSMQAMDRAAANGHIEVVRFLHEHRSEGCTVRAMDDAAANGHLAVIEFLHAHRAEGCTANALKMAIRNRHSDVMRFLCVHRPECDIASALAFAASAGDLECTTLLHASLRAGESAYAAVKAAAQPLKTEVVRFLCAHQEHEQTSLLTQAIADRAGWVVQAVCVHASMCELLEAKQHAAAQQQPRLVVILERQIRALRTSGVGVIE